VNRYATLRDPAAPISFEPSSSYCARSLKETATKLIDSTFVQFHMIAKVVTASIGVRVGDRPCVACGQPHNHATSLWPLRGTVESNFKSICLNLPRAAFIGDVEVWAVGDTGPSTDGLSKYP